MVSLVDRAPEYTYLQRVDRRTSAAVSAAMLAMPPPSDTPVHTVTADNGREFAGHAGVAEALKASFHFAPPPALLGEGPDRAHQRAGAAVPAEGDGPAGGHRRGGESGAGPPRRASAQGARLPDTRRGVPLGPPSLTPPGGVEWIEPSRARNHRRQGAGNPAFRPFSPPGRGKWPVLHFGLEVGLSISISQQLSNAPIRPGHAQ